MLNQRRAGTVRLSLLPRTAVDVVALSISALLLIVCVVLTGTPVENRLLDLWSLYAFAMPGLLGTQGAFKRLYDERSDPASACSSPRTATACARW